MPKGILKRIFPNLLLLTIVLAGIFFFAEVFLRFFMPQIFPVHPRGLYESHPEIGYVLSPGFKGRLQRAEYDVEISVNSEGLRGQEPGNDADDTFRILILGDSQAFGAGVADSATFAVQLSQMLRQAAPAGKIEVLNAAVPGYGTADQLHLLKVRQRQFAPDLIIVQFLSVNDFADNRTPAKQWADVREGMLVDRNFSPNEALLPDLSLASIQRWLKKRSHLAYLVSNRAGFLAMKWGLVGNMTILSGEDFTSEDSQRTTTLLREISVTADSLNAGCIFLYTTGQTHILGENLTPLRSEMVVKKAAKESNAIYLNSRKEMFSRQDRESLYYPMDGHWTTEGHQAIAKMLTPVVYKYLVENVNNQ